MVFFSGACLAHKRRMEKWKLIANWRNRAGMTREGRFRGVSPSLCALMVCNSFTRQIKRMVCCAGCQAASLRRLKRYALEAMSWSYRSIYDYSISLHAGLMNAGRASKGPWPHAAPRDAARPAAPAPGREEGRMTHHTTYASLRDADGRSERGRFAGQETRAFHRASARTSAESAYPGTHTSRRPGR